MQVLTMLLEVTVHSINETFGRKGHKAILERDSLKPRPSGWQEETSSCIINKVPYVLHNVPNILDCAMVAKWCAPGGSSEAGIESGSYELKAGASTA